MGESIATEQRGNRVQRGHSTGGDSALSSGEIYQTLSNRRRRHALHYLRQIEDPVDLRELSEQIAAWENGKECGSVTPPERKRVYTSLHQTHLPTMDRLQVIEYDKNRGTISPGEHMEEFDVYIDVVPRNDIPWNQFYLGVGATLSALVIVGWLDIPPFGGIDGFAYAGLSVLSISLLSLYHVLTDTRTKIGGTSSPSEILPPNDVQTSERSRE